MDNKDILNRLSKSKFRSGFHLSKKDFDYIESKGIDKIRSHATDFITKRLAPMKPINDGKQTPMHGHPVFVAQHATATCCRSCLYKWHKIKNDHDLTNKEIEYVVNLIMDYINIEINNAKE